MSSTADRSSSRSARRTVADALARLPGPAGERFTPAFRHGTLEVELYAPRGHDPQTPHRRDEAYVVVSGSGEFVHGGERTPFGPGDFLFVAAGVEHRFERVGDDLVVWVLFYGPDGGEQGGVA
jgi:mannose-6-phosphate isomerase-like protein (cupin superfamily)